ncbi:hypothetical protein QYF36_010173 [Acer negundo]|nr:hypothetical protein QYF36_010173 [Acer negundo]
MDTGLPGREEYENRGSWIPATPFRPILPKRQPIYTDGQANELDKAKWLESGCFSSDCSQGPQANNGFACFNPGIYTNMNGCINNWEGSSAGINCNNVEAGREFALDPMAQWKNIPCSNLLALANAAGIVNANIAAQRDVGTPSGSCISTAFSQTDGDPHHLLENANFSFRSNHWTNGNYAPTKSQYELSIPHQHSYDLNFPPGKMPNAVSNNTISEFVPITPDNGIRVKSKQVSELQNSCTNDRTHQERDGQNNEIAAERVDSNGIQCNKDLLDPVTDVSLAAESTHHMENHNPDKEAIDGIDLNKTPQQKQRRKKHRPKVITEGKPRTRKPVTPKPAVSKESPTGKRKYVRRKGLNNDSTTSPTKAAGESTNPETLESTKEPCQKTSNFDIKRQSRDENSTGKPTFDSVSESQAKDFYISKSTMQLSERIEVMTPKPAGSKANPRGKRKYVRKKVLNKDSTSSQTEPAGKSNDPKTPEPSKKSCKRTLNFDLEDQPRDENPTCESTIDLDSELQAKDSYRRIQSKATMQGDEGIEVIIENTQAGITYGLTRSVNGMLRDCISLAEGEAPTTPLPTKKIPRQQKSNAGRKNNAENEDQETTNDGQDHTKHVMLQIGTRASPNECGIYTNLIEQGQAQGPKRKSCNANEHANTGSFNQNGIHYHNFRSYQMQWAHFPIIYKKKRTEKGQNSTSSSTSSSITAAKDVTLETTCSQSETKTDSSASKADDWISAPQSNDKVVSATLGEARTGLQDKRQILEAILAMSPTEKLRRKRSRCPTRVRDLASLTRIAECTMQPTYPEIQGPMDRDKQQTGNLQRPHTCIEILVAKLRETLTQKKRTNKRNSLVKSGSSRINKMQKHNVILYSGHQFSASTLGALPELAWKQMFSIDAITEQLQHLDINRESSNIEYPEQYALVPYNMRNHEQNALILYGRDGTVVPFDGSINLVKKRRPRPKVELDEETNRVWKLLLENINSEGIDGTNEENTKWWEEERKVFSGRVDSFIARMHLVQGDRRFSPWKGSVVDSVVGVFLTQNVSDHLSSSAFMSLAAHFPHKMKNTKPCHVEGSSPVIEEPVDCILNPEDIIEWNEKMLHQPACDQGSITHHEFKHNEEKEVVSSNDSTGSSTCINLTNTSKCKLLNSCESGPETHADLIVNRSTTEIKGSGTVCSKGNRTETNVGISPQNSICFSIQNAERTRSSSDSNSDPGSLTNGSKLNSSTSFMELLQMTGSGMIHQVYNQGNGNMSSDENSQNEKNRFRIMEHDNQRQEVEHLDDPKKNLGVSSIQHHNFCSYITQKSAVVVECCGITREETRSSSVSNINDKRSVTEQIALTPEVTSQATDAIELTANVQEAPRSSTADKQSSNSMLEEKNTTAGHQSGLYGDSRFINGSLPREQHNEMPHQSLTNLSGESPDVGESSAFDNQNSGQQKTSYSFHKELKEYNQASSKAKSRRVGKEIKNDYDWDSLRRQVEANGMKREKTANTMDSLDWEAVRCADVNKIANTIKERGMNNMLAERIKDFLNRLVREHGSIDLEWLRDVPPDQAKEYLLSIRGLGLKSVECVRLLTLHQLAFPVDTNVGRIAVRLGWVPIQPLPESLQLHLLEMYPVLESIQKYLWPRLCKLDQRTLYELHYQMITFGKVFCTKSKPNCNACPMRGECRHFASAFASSRLALPGPEEKAIVSAEENRIPDNNPPVIINQLPLSLTQATELSVGNQQSEAKFGVNNCEPIIEEPATPEPQCTEISENDIEDTLCEDPDEIPTIKLNMEEFTQTLQNYMQKSMELQEGDMSKALVALTATASIPMPKLKNVNRLRTEHLVYELPDSHPLLDGLDKREPDDPGRYLLAIWTPGETANSIQPPERRCDSLECGQLCGENTCFSCNSFRESESQVVRGTLLIPCRTAMRGSFPLNGTYFQVNEVFADHDSSLCPITVPREWIWNLPRRTVYFGTSVPSIFKGLTTEGIQHCFWRGFVCVRGFDQNLRAPRPLMARLHFPASKLQRTQGKADGNKT